jgi:hypothetical protein
VVQESLQQAQILAVTLSLVLLLLQAVEAVEAAIMELFITEKMAVLVAVVLAQI